MQEGDLAQSLRLAIKTSANARGQTFGPGSSAVDLSLQKAQISTLQAEAPHRNVNSIRGRTGQDTPYTGFAQLQFASYLLHLTRGPP